MVDILFPTYNRLAFTQAALSALIANTEWAHVRRVVVMDDGSTDGTLEFVQRIAEQWPVFQIHTAPTGGPVAAMIRYLDGDPADLWAKVDSDTIVPPGWLGECLRVMGANPELDLLGIEAFHPAYGGQQQRRYVQASHIGGIGLFRTRAFSDRPTPNGRWGFTAWQDQHPDVVRGWLNPALPVFLLDRLPVEPWRSLSLEYNARGWQREWPVYEPRFQGHLWGWWL